MRTLAQLISKDKDIAAVRMLGAAARALKGAARGPLRRPLERLHHAVGELRFQYMYRSFSQLSHDSGGPVFMNYGLKVPTAESPKLEDADEPDRLFIQMYHRAIAGIDLSGRDVLEVSSGHGGGSKYVAHYLRPGRMVGVDLNDKAVDMSRARHKEPGLEFMVGNAIDLPFPDNSFDAIICIEASHRYPSLGAFLREVRRLLRSGGHLMFVDLRWEDGAHRAMMDAMAQCGMAVVDTEDLTSMVVASLDEFAAARRTSMAAIVPVSLLNEALDNSGLPGSPIYRALSDGSAIYQRVLLRKRD